MSKSSSQASSSFAAASSQAGIRTYVDPRNRHTYLYVPGSFTQPEAWQAARAHGGHPVVFNTLAEWRRVVQAFDYRTIAPAHTGHYQLPSGREPGLGWTTHPAGGVSTAPLNQLFNSNGPDDGVRNKWGWGIGSDGLTVYYGPSNGKNEDAGVIWHDNEGRLEDVSVNHRGGVVVEIPRSGRITQSTGSAQPSLVGQGSSSLSKDDLTQIGTSLNDTLIGGMENDVLIGLGGDDKLVGRQGDDVLKGGDGRDYLHGGVGQDILFGGNGRDLFVLNPGAKQDIIRDFEVGQDQLGLTRGISTNNLDILQQGNNTLIKVGDTAVALLRGINTNQITDNHFAQV